MSTRDEELLIIRITPHRQSVSFALMLYTTFSTINAELL